jgi:hypothetical protein
MKFPTVLSAVWLLLMPILACGQPRAPDAALGSSNIDSALREMSADESVKPPYRIEVWVVSVYGSDQPGTKTLIENYLQQDLQALGDVEFVDALDQKKPPAMLRLRVWFSKLEMVSCFDMNLGVAVGKIDREKPAAELVLDTYGLAGIEEREIELLCQAIVTRLDLKILSSLRRMKTPSKVQ